MIIHRWMFYEYSILWISSGLMPTYETWNPWDLKWCWQFSKTMASLRAFSATVAPSEALPWPPWWHSLWSNHHCLCQFLPLFLCIIKINEISQMKQKIYWWILSCLMETWGTNSNEHWQIHDVVQYTYFDHDTPHSLLCRVQWLR